MINTDEDALICDLAETYQIYDYKSLPVYMAAIFSRGLRDDSRIKMKFAGTTITSKEMMLAAIADNTRLIAWLNSEDGANGTNRPKSLLGNLLRVENNSEIVSFGTGKDFDEAWKKMSGKEE